MTYKESDFYVLKIGSLYKLRGSVIIEASPLLRFELWLINTLGRDMAEDIYPWISWNYEMEKEFRHYSLKYYSKTTAYKTSYLKKNLPMWNFNAPIARSYSWMKYGYLYIRKEQVSDVTHDYFNKAVKQFNRDLEELLK